MWKRRLKPTSKLQTWNFHIVTCKIQRTFIKDQQTMMKQLFVSPQFSPTNRRTFDQQLATRLFDLETGSPRAKYKAPVLQTSPWYTWNRSDIRWSHAVVTKTDGENQSWNQRQKYFNPDPLSWIRSSILWWDDIERWDDTVKVKATSNKCFHFSGKNPWQSFESTCSCLIELCLIFPRILVEVFFSTLPSFWQLSPFTSGLFSSKPNIWRNHGHFRLFGHKVPPQFH